jgi:hypothetical protein
VTEYLEAHLTFLIRCLEEDAAVAREASRRDGEYVAGGAHWVWEVSRTDEECALDPVTQEFVGDDHQAGTVSLRSREEFPAAPLRRGLPQFALSYVEEAPVSVGMHILRHDPASVLADIEAKREIIQRHERLSNGGRSACQRCWPARCDILTMARAYRERPGYPGNDPERAGGRDLP